MARVPGATGVVGIQGLSDLVDLLASKNIPSDQIGKLLPALIPAVIGGGAAVAAPSALAGVGNFANLQAVPNSAVVPIMVEWEDTAFAEYSKVREWQLNQSRGDDALWVRYTEISVKLAMIEAIARDPISPIVTFEIFKMANDLARWSFYYTADLIVKEVSENEIEASHKKILNIIRKSGEDGMSTTQLAKICQGMKARDRNEILQTLVESGDLVEEVIKGTAGRDRRVYRARVR